RIQRCKRIRIQGSRSQGIAKGATGNKGRARPASKAIRYGGANYLSQQSAVGGSPGATGANGRDRIHCGCSSKESAERGVQPRTTRSEARITAGISTDVRSRGV